MKKNQKIKNSDFSKNHFWMVSDDFGDVSDLKNPFFDRSVHGKRDNVILECSGGESVLGWFLVAL